MSFVLPTYGKFPVTLTKGKGTRVWDDAGKTYLDFCSGIATCSIGHCHPAQQQAIANQASELIHCSNLYHIPQQETLAERLVNDYVGAPGKIFFSNSGAEANDGMIKTARKFGHAKPNKNNEPRYEIITFSKSFHGRTLGSMAATAQTKIQQGFTPLLPGFRYVEFNDTAALRNAITPQTCAILLEPIQGEGGVNVADPEFLQQAANLSQEHDLLLMFDEIQCGIARCGTPMGWQSILPEIQPDLVSFAKGLGGGFPIGAFYVSDRAIDDKTQLSSLMGPGTHGSTYGGNPLACSAALSVLNVIAEESLAENIQQQSKRIRETIASWQSPHISEIRGNGLLIGLALNPDAMDALTLCQTLIEAGLLTVPAGPETLRLLPPLNVNNNEVEEALNILQNILT